MRIVRDLWEIWKCYGAARGNATIYLNGDGFGGSGSRKFDTRTKHFNTQGSLLWNLYFHCEMQFHVIANFELHELHHFARAAVM